MLDRSEPKKAAEAGTSSLGRFKTLILLIWKGWTDWKS